MSNTRFLVIGEALVDIIEHPDGTHSGHPGGSPTNVAVGLARLGHDVTELCSLGDDSNGDLLRAYLRTAGVKLHSQSIRTGSTSTASSVISLSGDARYDFSVSWDTPPAIAWDGVDVVHAGSIALALQPGAARVLSLLRSRPVNVRLSIDPNVRAAFLPRKDAATRLEDFVSLADLVKLSDEDAAYLYPELANDPHAAIERILALGPTIVAMTLGSAGAIVAIDRDRIWVPATAGSVADTIGAGDSFMAALLDAIAHSSGNPWAPTIRDIERYAKHASLAAAITVSRPGADLPWRNEMAL